MKQQFSIISNLERPPITHSSTTKTNVPLGGTHLVLDDNLLNSHLNVAMNDRQAVHIVEPIERVDYHVLMDRRSRTNAARRARHQRHAGLARVASPLVVVIAAAIVAGVTVTVERRHCVDPLSIRLWYVIRRV